MFGDGFLRFGYLVQDFSSSTAALNQSVLLYGAKASLSLTVSILNIISVQDKR